MTDFTFRIFVTIERDPVPAVVETIDNQFLDKDVSFLNLPGLVRGCLENGKIRTIKELCAKRSAELIAFNNFGRVSLVEVCRRLEALGLSLADDPVSHQVWTYYGTVQVSRMRRWKNRTKFAITEDGIMATDIKVEVT